MTDSGTLNSYAEMATASALKDAKVYSVSHNEQMLLPTMELYLSTVISMPVMSRRRSSKTARPRESAPHTIQMWERLS